jgi:hypothetical protein
MTGTNDTPVQVALLVNDDHIHRWKRNAVSTLTAESAIEITHVIVNKQTSGADHGWESFIRNAVTQFREDPLWSIVGIARLLTTDPEYKESVPLDTISDVSDAEWISCSPQPLDKYWKTLPDEAVACIEDVDVIIRFGFGMIRGPILKASKYGVLSYHPGDIRVYRGQPGGFWEFLNGDDVMGVTVQRLNNTLDGGEIAELETVDISDVNTWQEIQRRAYHTAEGMLVPAVNTLISTNKDLQKPDELGELYSLPKGWAVLKYVAMNTLGRTKNLVEHGVPRSPTTQWKNGVASLLSLSGLLVLGLHPVFTHHFVTQVHVEGILGISLLIYGIATLANQTQLQLS